MREYSGNNQKLINYALCLYYAFCYSLLIACGQRLYKLCVGRAQTQQLVHTLFVFNKAWGKTTSLVHKLYSNCTGFIPQAHIPFNFFTSIVIPFFHTTNNNKYKLLKGDII